MQRSLPWCFGVALVTTTSFTSERAFAVSNDADPIELYIAHCPDVSFAELRRLLAVELAWRPEGLPAETLGAADPGRERIIVDCLNADSGSIANVSLLDVTTGQTASRPIDLTSVPSTHRPRFLAIAIAELVRDPKEEMPFVANADHSETPTPRASVPQAVGVSVDEGDPKRGRTRWRFDIAAIALRSSGFDTFLGGGMARASRGLSDWLAAEVDVESVGGSVPVSLGSAEILLVSAGAAALARIRLGPFGWQSGIGFRAGLARLSGTPANALSRSVQSRTVLEPWGGPFLTTRLAAETGHRISVLLALEGGYSADRVVGKVDGATEIAITNFWTSLSFGFGWSP